MTVVFKNELEILQQAGYNFSETWEVIDIFEKKLATFFGAPCAVVVDSCTHALELCLKIIDQPQTTVQIPVHTYMSVPMMLEKINQSWQFVDLKWSEYYKLDPLPVIDAACMWKPNSYQSGTLTCISFQHKKHIAIGRAAVILTDCEESYEKLQRLCRDGRNRKLLQNDDDIKEIGYHYYVTPEDAAQGILLFDQRHHLPSKTWSWQDYKMLTDHSVFKAHLVMAQ